MDFQESTAASDLINAAGPSGQAAKRGRDRSSSSSSTSSSSSNLSNSDCKRAKRSRGRRRKRDKRIRSSDRKIEKLMKEMGELRKHIFTSNYNNHLTNQDNDVSIWSDASGELYERYNVTDSEVKSNNCENSNSEFTYDIETKLKEPPVPKTPQSFINMLFDVQRLGTTSWSEVRYAETQKAYNHTPGFVDLDVNEEVKIYDTLRHLANSDKSYAAITYCVLKQKEALQEGIRKLLSWAKVNTINFENISEKVEELIVKGDFQKTSSDLLQIVCGHRAECVEMRRDSITSQVKDPLVKASLTRIPPSSTYLFDSEPFTTTLEKAGGVRKAFWPPKSDGFSHTKLSNSRPSRGRGMRYTTVPSRGTRYEPGWSGKSHATYNPPSRGVHHQYSSYAHRNQFSTIQHDCNIPGKSNSTFLNRGSRPDRGGNRRRAEMPNVTRGNQKRYKQ